MGFIQQATIPFLQMLINAGENVVLHDLDNRIIFSSDNVCEFVFNLPFSKIKNKHIFEIYSPADENMHIINNVRNYTQRTRHSVTCIRTPSEIFPQIFTRPNSEHQQQFPLFSIRIFPVVDNSGDTVATFSIYQLFNNYDLFYSIYYTQQQDQRGELEEYTTKTALSDCGLSKRELEILYLLSQNLSQRTIAKVLNVTRGTITKIISEKIYIKLGITTNSSKALIQRAIELGINDNIPQSLLPNGVVLSCNNKIKNILSRDSEIEF